MKFEIFRVSSFFKFSVFLKSGTEAWTNVNDLTGDALLMKYRQIWYKISNVMKKLYLDYKNVEEWPLCDVYNFNIAIDFEA